MYGDHPCQLKKRVARAPKAAKNQAFQPEI
jgi:hypothetical protein